MNPQIVNMTPHTITVLGEHGDVLAQFPPSGNVARSIQLTTQVGSLGAVPLSFS